MNKFMAAAVQMTSTDDVERNTARAIELIGEAADRGAVLIGLPEVWPCIRTGHNAPPEPMSLDDGPFARLRELCRDRKITLVAGTIPERGPGERVYNTCAVIGPAGGIIDKYRKIHLYDVDIPGGVTHMESKHVAPGDRAVVVQTEHCPVGLTVCYDLRFPELYRLLARRGARVIFTPAAFMLYTGKDHWVPLLRARAIENLAYIVAPGQFGNHNEKRASYGKSLIVDPWGNVLATAPDRESVAVAEIDLDAQDEIRRQLPALDHLQDWLFKEKS